MENKSHNTAITRKKPSAPIRYLDDNGLLSGRMLDYGCGRGFDAEYYGMKSYDPYWSPEFPDGKFDTVVCTYVLNVVSEEAEKEIISSIRNILADDGVAYLSVRRDLKEWGINKRGVLQRKSTPDLPIVVENSNYCIYRLDK